MTQLTDEQVTKIRTKVNASTERYVFEHACTSDKDRKLVVLAIYANDGAPHAAAVTTGSAPNWLSNEEQFVETVDAVVSKLARPGFG
jgi:hypothetical protein